MTWDSTRRKLLAAGGTALATLVGGCQALFGNSTDTATPTDTPGSTATPTQSPTATATQTKTATETATETTTVAEHVVDVGAGSYRTSQPTATEAPPDPVYATGGNGPPYPTNGWWTTLLWEELGNTLWSHPLVTNPEASGLRVGFPQEWVAGEGPAGPNFAQFPETHEFTLSTGGTYNQTLVTDWSDWSVSYLFDGDPLMLVTQPRGSPYLFVESEDGISLDFAAEPEVWADRDGTLGVTVDGSHYGLYAPSGASWTGDGSTRSNDLGGDGYCTVAALPEQSTDALAALGEYAHNHVTETRVEWTYDEDAGEVRTTYSVDVDAKEGEGSRTVFGLYPHQHKYTDADLLGLTYESPRGTLQTHVNDSYETVQQFSGVLPFLPDEGEYSASRMQQYVDQARSRATIEPGPEDPTGGTYWTGKNFARLAEAAPVARQFGEGEAADEMRAAMREELETWLTAVDDGTLAARDVFYYNDTWGTLQGYPAGFGSPAGLNDHHFHYGYFVRAAAELARADPEWAEQWAGIVELLVRDYAGPDREDEMFPFLRNFDPYGGHSWAGGNNGGFAAGNNQESSSEAVNAYAAMIQWGEYTGNTELRDAGVFLYTQETTAAREYWFDEDDENLPEVDGWEYDYACQVWGNGVAWTTWWTSEVEAIYLINVLPVGGHSLYLGLDDEAARATYDDMVARDDPDYSYYPGIEAKYFALGDPDAALTKWRSLRSSPSYAPGLGESVLHTAHWIHNLAAMGTPAPVTADHPLAAAFERDGQRAYVAYNPDDSATTVTFDDGTRLSVPAGELATTTG